MLYYFGIFLYFPYVEFESCMCCHVSTTESRMNFVSKFTPAAALPYRQFKLM